MAFRFLVSGGTSNWNSTSNWSDTSGGASGFSFPVFGDDVVCDAGSANAALIINGSSECRSFSASPNYAGTVSGSGALFLSGGTITFSTGMTITATGSLGISGSTTITSNDKAWLGALQPRLPGTYTLNDDFTVASISHAVSGGFTAINGNNLNVLGTVTLSSGRSLSGTTKIRLVGTGTATVSGLIQNSLDIATSGTTTFGTSFNYNSGTITYVSGITNTSSNNTLVACAASTTWNTSGMTWARITFSVNATQTINSLLETTGQVQLGSANQNFSGTAGWTFADLTMTTGDQILTAGLTYNVLNALTATGTLANRTSFSSSVPGTKAKLILGYGATQNLDYLNGTDIDSSDGQTIWSYKGTLSNTINWNNIVPQNTSIGFI